MDDTFDAKTAAAARSFLFELQTNVRAGRKDKVRIDGYVAQYDSIITPGIKNAILSEWPGCRFGNWQGGMIGQGELWFAQQQRGGFKIITVNIPEPRKQSA